MNIYITLDYELFLGPKTGSVDKCLIEPTYNLCKVVSKHGSKMVFFIDVLYLIKLREYSSDDIRLQEDYNKIIKQLKFLDNEGHDLQLHIHPQWNYSTYDKFKREWKLDFIHYSVSDCPFDDVKKMFVEGCNFIYDIIGKYPTVYRAGGYSFMNESNFVDFLVSIGITNDSSVLMREKSCTKFQKYDYSSIKDFSAYKFSNDITKPVQSGCMTEYPITTINMIHVVRSIVNRFIKHKYGNRVLKKGDGYGVGYLNRNKSNVSLFKKINQRASIDLTNGFWLNYIYNKIKKRGDLMLIIGHPKNFTDYSFIALGKFLDTISKDDKIKTFK